MPKVKICGIQYPEDVKIINRYKPEYIGFVFAANSKRKIDIDKAKELKRSIDKEILTVGVFQDNDQKLIKKLVAEDVIDMIQLHGNEDENYIKSLKACAKPIIKAITIKERSDYMNAMESGADYVMLDNGGGSGKRFDWDIIGDDSNDKVFLAGGLGIDNIAEAIKKIKPYAVDVSSGVEKDRYKGKDDDLVREFIEKVRTYD